MYIEKIRFDEVFDVIPNLGLSSFSAGGKKTYGVAIAPHMIPQAGTTYLVAFTKPNDWQTVAGWRDCSTGELVLKYSGTAYWLDAWINGLFLLPYTLYSTSRINSEARVALDACGE